MRLGKWTVSAGLRWDHYQLLLNQNAFSPRLAASRYFPGAGAVVHASYDRVFQTPSFENHPAVEFARCWFAEPECAAAAGAAISKETTMRRG